MSRRKCCCKNTGPDPDDPKPDSSKCTKPPIYATESIAHTFSDPCNPRLSDGFEQSDFCLDNRLTDQTGAQLKENYSGRLCSFLRTQNTLGPVSNFYANSGGGNATGESTGISLRHRFHIKSLDMQTIGFTVDGSIDLGFRRFNRLDVDAAGWGGLGPAALSNSPYPKQIDMTAVIGSNFYVLANSYDFYTGSEWSLGLPSASAYYKTRIIVSDPSGRTVYGQKTFNTPLSHFYNADPTSSFILEIDNVEYLAGGNIRLTVDITVTHGGDSLVLTGVQRTAGPCFLESFLYGLNWKSESFKLANTGDGSGTNNETSYDDAVGLAASYPDIAFCFSTMDNFNWQ